MTTVTLGTISHGTLRTEDLLKAFADALEGLSTEHAALIAEAREVDVESDDASGVVEELIDALNEFAPDYCYFGAHPGDGSDFGFWLLEDWQQLAKDDDVLFVADTSEVPGDYEGLVCHGNDHGNATLYSCQAGGKLNEVWSVV